MQCGFLTFIMEWHDCAWVRVCLCTSVCVCHVVQLKWRTHCLLGLMVLCQQATIPKQITHLCYSVCACVPLLSSATDIQITFPLMLEGEWRKRACSVLLHYSMIPLQKKAYSIHPSSPPSVCQGGSAGSLNISFEYWLFILITILLSFCLSGKSLRVL